mgnify:CR=1 FL=1
MKQRMIVLIGAPGSGKSAIGKSVAEFSDTTYISSGDIARALGDTTTKRNLAKGGMAHESKMRETVHYMLSVNKHWDTVLDGFPRTSDQRQWLEDCFDDQYDIKYVEVDASLNTCMRRLKARHRSDDNISVILKRYEHYINHTIDMIDSITDRIILYNDNITVEQATMAIARRCMGDE